MQAARFKNAKIPADVIERAGVVAPILNTTIGSIIADATRPHLDRLEREALSRFRSRLEKNAGGKMTPG
jgi:hypothetical protein